MQSGKFGQIWEQCWVILDTQCHMTWFTSFTKENHFPLLQFGQKSIMKIVVLASVPRASIHQLVLGSYIITALHFKLVLTEFSHHQWPKYPDHVQNYPAQHCFSFCNLIGRWTIALTFNFHIWKEHSQHILRMYGTHPWDCRISSKHIVNMLHSKPVRNSTPLP